jgi:hypothetical protein
MGRVLIRVNLLRLTKGDRRCGSAGFQETLLICHVRLTEDAGKSAGGASMFAPPPDSARASRTALRTGSPGASLPSQ